MNNLPFILLTMFAFGQGEASRVGALVRQFGGSKVLLVAGGGSVKKNGAYDAATAALEGGRHPVARAVGVQANPHAVARCMKALILPGQRGRFPAGHRRRRRHRHRQGHRHGRPL